MVDWSDFAVAICIEIFVIFFYIILNSLFKDFKNLIGNNDVCIIFSFTYLFFFSLKVIL